MIICVCVVHVFWLCTKHLFPIYLYTQCKTYIPLWNVYTAIEKIMRIKNSVWYFGRGLFTTCKVSKNVDFTPHGGGALVLSLFVCHSKAFHVYRMARKMTNELIKNMDEYDLDNTLLNKYEPVKHKLY